MAVSETELPGVGRRFELDVRDRRRLVSVVHDRGPRDLYVFEPAASSAGAAVHLDEQSAQQLGAVLGGSRYRPPMSDPMVDIIDRYTVQRVVVPPGSPAHERSIEDLEIRRRTGASIIAISSGSMAIVDPQASSVIREGDELLVVGDRDQLAAVRYALGSADQGAPDT